MYSWKLPEVVSTRVPFASAVVKSRCVPFLWKLSGERLNDIHQHGIKNVRVLDRTFNYNNKRAKELLDLFRQYPDICFHLEIHPALLSEELKQELSVLPKGLLHLEAGIQSLKESVLQQSRRIGKLSDALEGLKYLCSLKNMETHADLIAVSHSITYPRYSKTSVPWQNTAQERFNWNP